MRRTSENSAAFASKMVKTEAPGRDDVCFGLSRTDQTITALFPIPSFPLLPRSARGGACSRSYLEICCSLAGTAHRCKALYRVLIESNAAGLCKRRICCLSLLFPPTHKKKKNVDKSPRWRGLSVMADSLISRSEIILHEILFIYEVERN